MGMYGHRIMEFFTTIKNVTRWKATPPCWLNMKSQLVLVARSALPLRPGAVSASASRPATRAHEKRASVASKKKKKGE